MEVLKAIFFKLGQLFLGTFGVFRRALCCFRRRRRVSDYGLPFTTNDLPKSTLSGFIINPLTNELQSWDSWNDGENGMTAVSMIVDETQKGANGLVKERHSFSEEEGADFFKEMTPAITKPKKFLIKTSGSENLSNDVSSSRLSMDLKASLSQTGAELGTIDDYVESWEDAAASEELWDGEIVLKEQRLAERQRRIAEHQRKKFEKDAQRLGRNENAPICTRLS